MNDLDTKTWFSHQVEEHTDSLYGYAFRLTRNRADAEDLVAESVTKAWSAIESLKDKSLFRSWLLRILHNSYVSQYRKKKIRPVELSYHDALDNNEEDDFTEFLSEMSDDFLTWWGTPVREFANKVLQRDILAAVEGLPEVFRTVVALVTVEGFSYDEAGEVLGIPSGTVHSRMKRGRTLLQKALWEHALEAGIITNNKTEEYAP